MKAATFWTILVMVGLSAIHVFADNKKQKHKVDRKAWNPYACCHDMNHIEHTPVLIVENYLVPEFYYTDTLHKADTSFVYEIYDSRDSLMNIDTVQDFAKVRYLSLFKNFIDHEHFYKDDNGIKQPLPVQLITRRYDKLGKDKWMSIAYPGNKFTELKEFKNDIVRTDSFMEEGATKNEMILSIFKYYKVATLK